jgi:hypothetical protein
MPLRTRDPKRTKRLREILTDYYATAEVDEPITRKVAVDRIFAAFRRDKPALAADREATR